MNTLLTIFAYTGGSIILAFFLFMFYTFVRDDIRSERERKQNRK